MKKEYGPPKLSEFLAQVVDGYLLADLKSMINPQKEGGCGYPILMTVCAGIELLGTLAAQGPFTGDTGENEFVHYWQTYLYPRNSGRWLAGKGVYFLVRHGIAHMFMTKGLIRVTKEKSDRHFTTHGQRTFTIDAILFADEFKQSYEGPFQADVAVRAKAKLMQDRLDQVWDKYMGQAYGEDWDTSRGDKLGFFERFFSSLPQADPPTGGFSGSDAPQTPIAPAATTWPR